MNKVMPIIINRDDQNVPVKSWMNIESAGDSNTIDQARKTAMLPWTFKHVALMPDGHVGVGATIGSVVALKDAVSPAMVGVDIGCGMMAGQTTLKASDLPDNLEKIRSAVESVIPVGFNSHEHTVVQVRQQKGFWSKFRDLNAKIGSDAFSRAKKQMGTLGGGNHFVELCVDTEDTVWLMLHSGSRYIGNLLAKIHISKAKELVHNTNLPDRDLAVFLAGTKEMQEYLHDLKWAQEYALLNRNVMFELYVQALSQHLKPFTIKETVRCHHNYVSEETHFDEEVIVTRKGAISARLGQLGIIPGSMGAKSYIVTGLGNPESFYSASHGAGRKMSRGAAKRTFTVNDLEQQTDGVCCRKDAGVLDEIPGAYKDIDIVMENQKDLVEIVHEIKAIMCIKG